MPADALLLVMAGAILHAIWNLFAKKASGGLPFVWLFGLVSLGAALPFGIVSWLRHGPPPDGRAWAAILATAVVHIVYSLVLQQGYISSDFSVVYPLARGTGPLFAVALAVVLLRESPSALGWAGIASILAGLFLISGALRVFSSSSRTLAGLGWGSLTGLCIAAYTVIDGWAVKSLGMPPVLYYSLGLTLRTFLLAPVALRAPQALCDQWRSNGRWAIGVGILSPLAYTLVLFAMQRAPLSYVAPVRELSMLGGVLIGTGVLRESFLPSRVAGTVLMVAGVVLLAFAK